MTPRSKTAIFLGAYVLLFLLGLLGMAVWSYNAGASISGMLTGLWDAEPYVVLVASTLVAYAWGFLCGHWFGRARPSPSAADIAAGWPPMPKPLPLAPAPPRRSPAGR